MAVRFCLKTKKKKNTFHHMLQMYILHHYHYHWYYLFDQNVGMACANVRPQMFIDITSIGFFYQMLVYIGCTEARF